MLPAHPFSSAHMANNLIKWWRTKFLNGYKQFSVLPSDCSDGRPSDTEELLGHVGGTGACEYGFGVNGAALPTCSTPPPANRVSPSTPVQGLQVPQTSPVSQLPHVPQMAPVPPPSTSPPQDVPQPSSSPPLSNGRHLNLEEFSCDVSMEGGIYRDGQERQEFSFTLYDFDGHGKITKDDITGLVTTIYETLGSSVKVPHYGSKTIKVKLTVSPDQRKRMSATVIDHKTPEHKNNCKRENSDRQTKRDVNVTVKDTPKHKKQCRRQKLKEEHLCCNYTCKEDADISDIEQDYSDHCSRMSDDEMSEDEGECSEGQILKYPSCEKVKYRHYQKHSNTRDHMHTNSSTQSAHVPLSPVLCTKVRRSKKRSSSLQRKELLEIIQANMDKNNHGFQTSEGKQFSSHVNDNESAVPIDRKQNRHKHKSTRNSTAQLHCLANIVNSNKCYLDLATLQSNHQIPVDGQNSIKDLPYCRYDKLLGAVVCMSNKQINSSLLQHSPLMQSPCKNRRHCRSRSHDLSQVPFRYHLLEPRVTENLSPRSVKRPNAKSKSYEAEFEQTPAAFKKNVKRFPQVVLGHSSSPHHLKHRNRQEDQARAMAQVVRWLEQEFSSNVNVNGKTDGAKKSKGTSKQSPQQSSRSSPNHEPTSPSVSGVERHEHHHVHEHIHHHYHHYQEAPVVV